MNDEIYRNALERIECDSRFKPTGCCCGNRNIPGPTGPTGPQGPATITIGTTTTSAPGTPASVTNVGTIENPILNFSIPSGFTGPTGPQGLAGSTGATARFIYSSKKRRFLFFYFVPKIRSPASPNPGTIYLFSFNFLSIFPQ